MQPSTPPSFPAALRPELHEALAQLGYEAPTAIQQAAVPVILDGRDVVGCAQTGAHGTVQSCQCEPMKGAACGAEDCKVHEYR